MADALISPAVGGTMWVASAAVTYYAAKKTGKDLSDQKVPLMGVLGAFVFAVQMINFAIPGTGSSGHLAGGMLLSVLLGPHAGFLTMTSILTIQALLFADGGLLALGCNIFNMAFFSCYLAYSLIYRKIVNDKPSRLLVAIGVTLSTISSLLLGALGVVAETSASGISDLPYQTFALFMLPIHFVIGAVEAAVTTVVLWYLWQQAPTLFAAGERKKSAQLFPLRRVVLTVMLVAVMTSGFLSWFASTRPDGLEWAVSKTTGSEEVANTTPLHELAALWQRKSAVFADYQVAFFAAPGKGDAKREEQQVWPAVNESTSGAGVLGSVLTLLAAGGIGAGCRVLAKRSAG